jgi:hypothetical protein
MLKKQNFLLVITFLMSINKGFAQEPPPPVESVPIDNYVFGTLILGVLYVGYFLNKNKSFKTNN